MFIAPVILLGVGLIFFSISKKIDNDIERLDANFLGDILPNPDEDAMYKFERKIKVKNSKGSKNFAYLLIFWSIVWFVVMLLGIAGLF